MSTTPDSLAEVGRTPGELLAGGGEIGKLIRAMAWAHSGVGPMESWPQSLKTALSVCLGSKFPMFVWWGPDLTAFYNDAYAPILGPLKHPRFLGRSAREQWAEVWDTLGPLTDQVMQDGSATWFEDFYLFPVIRQGFSEETYFTFSYSPVRDESGEVGGVFCACQETTKRVLGDRRLRSLRELGHRATNARHAEEASQITATVLSANSADVPFALIYLVEGGAGLVLSARTGAALEGRRVPTRIALDGGSALSENVARALREGKPIVLEEPLEALGEFAQSPWPEPLRQCVVLPIASSEQSKAAAGVMIIGVSPRLPFDDDYRGYLDLVTGQLATAIASARTSEEERKRAEALAQLDRAKTTFFSNVSHEFRTPLTLILGPVTDALTLPNPSLAGEKLDLVGRNARRLLKLVNTLLDFSRIEAGRAEAHYQPTELSGFTADLASSFRSLVERGGLSLTVDCPPLAEPVFVDREMYEKVVLNLLSNAFKFTLEGDIRVSLEAHQGNVRLTVADTGVGIPAAELPHVFERFHRVEGAKGRSYEGSGIGLALVRELVSLHGGTVAVEGGQGGGCRFIVCLPLGKAHLPAERVQLVSALAAPGPSSLSFLDEASNWLRETPVVLPTDDALPSGMFGRILLAEDNADMRDYVRRLLTAHGWDVEAVGDGEAALQRARVCLPDLVLADVMMPGLGGFGLLQALKDDEKTSAVPVILLSARSGEEASLEGMRKGADDYLVKPFSAKDLVSRVAARLKIARSRAESLTREKAVREQAVAEQERLHALFVQTPVAIAILEGPRHTYAFANPAYRALLGGRDLVGKPLLEAVPEVRGQGIDVLMDQVVATGVPFIGSELLVNLDRTGTGHSEDVFYNLIYSPRRDAGGGVDGLFVCASDVTEQVRARRRVESLLQELKVADQRKDEFLAMLAHELRNPLAAIMLAHSLIERVEGDEAPSAKFRQTAQRSTRNLVRLVDDLLDVSRITRGLVELRLTQVDLATLIQNVVTATRLTIAAHQHELSVTVASGAFRLTADANRLEQVLVNLLTNASKFTPPGGSLWVGLGRETVNGTAMAVVRVRDSGRGIPPEMLDKVFDLFVQVSPGLDRGAGGLGLGLTLVKRLVEMHGGTVSAHSDGLGKGSEFVVRLPLLADMQAAPPGPFQAPQPVFSRRRIVLVEDSVEVRETLKDFLESVGHEVVVASDGLEGAERIRTLCPDVALVDVGLPGIDGYEVARRIRAEPGGEQHYLVALTGYGGPEATARAEGAGFDLHITKPIEVDELMRVVSRHRPER